MLNSFLQSLANLMRIEVLLLMLLIAAFGYFIDAPALKEQGLMRDAKLTIIISSVEVILVIVFFIIGRIYK